MQNPYTNQTTTEKGFWHLFFSTFEKAGLLCLFFALVYFSENYKRRAKRAARRFRQCAGDYAAFGKGCDGGPYQNAAGQRRNRRLFFVGH